MGQKEDQERGEAVTRAAAKKHAQEEAKRPLRTGENRTSDTDNWEHKPPTR